MPSTSLAGAMPLSQSGSGRRRGASVKTLKRMLKKAGLKTTGRKAALTRRAKKAHLKVRGGAEDDVNMSTKQEDVKMTGEGDMEVDGGRRRRRHSRKH